MNKWYQDEFPGNEGVEDDEIFRDMKLQSKARVMMIYAGAASILQPILVSPKWSRMSKLRQPAFMQIVVAFWIANDAKSGLKLDMAKRA